MIEQELLQVGRTLVADLDADGRTLATGFELPFQGAHKITDFFLVDVEV